MNNNNVINELALMDEKLDMIRDNQKAIMTNQLRIMEHLHINALARFNEDYDSVHDYLTAEHYDDVSMKEWFRNTSKLLDALGKGILS